MAPREMPAGFPAALPSSSSFIRQRLLWKQFTIMEVQVNSHHELTGQGRPYRSHLHPACFSCRKRKSRCKTREPAGVCIMCQAHSTECIFPRPDVPYQRRSSRSPRESSAHVRSQTARSRIDLLHGPYPSPLAGSQAALTAATQSQVHSQISGDLVDPVETLSHPGDGQRAEGVSQLLGIATEAGDDSSHTVSPAVADDSEFLEGYLSAIPTAQRRYLVRTGPSSDRPPRPVRFNLVPRRPLGVTANQPLASSKCEIIEKYMDPDLEEYMKL